LLRKGLPLLAVLLAMLCAGCGRRKVEVASSDEAFQLGWNNYRLADYDRAARFFNESLALATNDAQRIRALYSMGDLWNFRSPGRSEKEAEKYYQQVIEGDTTGAWAPWAALTLARQAQVVAVVNLPDLAVLEERYGGVMRDYPGHAAADEAFLYLQVARLVQGDDETIARAAEELEEWVEARTDSPYLPNGYGWLAHAYMLQGRGRAYIEALVTSVERSLEQQQNSLLPPGDQAGNYFKIAMAAQLDAGDFELARKYYNLLMERSPTDQRVFVSEQRLALMEAFEAEARREIESGAWKMETEGGAQ